MKKNVSALMALLLCLAMSIQIFAADGERERRGTGTGTVGDSIIPGIADEVDASNENESTAPSTPAQPESPAATESHAPTPTPAPTGSGSGSSSSGYASPIVNIEAIEVPLDDGTSIVLPFLDVPQEAYYTAAVAWAYSHDPQITGGVSAERFDPLATCTRGQMVTFLWRAAGCPEPTGTASAFSDVAAGAYYEKAVAWAVENNITDGVGDGRFDPNGIVNRAQAVTFLYRAKGAPETAASESFTDVASGAWYENAVAWAVANEITNGVGDNAFAPNNNCVRGQTVTFLYRAYK